MLKEKFTLLCAASPESTHNTKEKGGVIFLMKNSVPIDTSNFLAQNQNSQTRV